MPKIIAFTREHKAGRMPNAGSPRQASENERIASSITQLYPDLDGVMSAVPGITVSIVVPTKGRPQLLNRCLASLVLQDFDRRRFEIIVVDDGPDNDTREAVIGWSTCTAGSGPEIAYIPSMGPHGPAAARNRGWHAARGDIVAFTDDDTVAETGWLQKGHQAFEDGVDAVWGRIHMPLNGDGKPTDYERDARNLESAEFVTANCFVRKRVLERVGGFDERFRFAWREDSDLYFNLLSHDARIVHAPEAVMKHPIRPARWGVSLRQLKKVQFDALLFKKHPRLYRQKIRAAPRWDFYLTVASLLALAGAVLAGDAVTAISAGLLWLFMTGRFCALRLKNTSKAPSHIAEMLVTSALIPPLALFWRAVGALKFRAGLL